MKNFCIFADAINYIEGNLCSPIVQEDIAAACYCSLSALQKVWRYCSHTSLKEYISKRRLTRSAEDIVRTDMTLTDIAMKYQYNSPEVFLRAFFRFWGVTPSKFKEHWRSTGLFPRIIPDEQMLEGGVYMGRKVDISELYDELKAMGGDTFVLCFDIVKFDGVNKSYGRTAGDSVIREAFHRVDAAADKTMTAFRIGGDEFALITGLSDKEKVEETAQRVISLNGQSVEFEGQMIPLSLRVGAIPLSISRNVRYSELFDRMQHAINETRDVGKVIYFLND